MTDRIRFAKTCRRAGVVVDHLMDKFQPLDKVFHGFAGINGFTIPRKGNAGLMLDAQGLVRRAAGSGNRSNRASFNDSGAG